MEGSRKEKQRGFTVIEMIIVVAIFGIVTVMAVLPYETNVSGSELDQAAWELAGDIRYMQQQSTDDPATEQAGQSVPATVTAGGTGYGYRLRIWGADYTGALAPSLANTYEVLDQTGKVLKGPVSFAACNVKAYIVMAPPGSGAVTNVDMTYYAFDHDMLVGGSLVNSRYRIRLDPINSTVVKSRYVNVDSRMGRVWVTSDSAALPLAVGDP